MALPQQIVLAIVSIRDRLVLQLRDFEKEIADPGEWGLFGGHLRPEEDPEEGLRRELIEELGWSPNRLWRLGSFCAPETHHMIVIFGGELTMPLETLVLGEGQEIGAFLQAEIETGVAYSRRWSREFPVTAITLEALHLSRGGAVAFEPVRHS